MISRFVAKGFVMSAVRISDIKDVEIKRFETGFPDLDWIYGESNIVANGVHYTSKGLPYGGLSLWGGEAGVGKTRVAVEVCKHVSSQHLQPVPGGFLSRKVLYFQLETTLPQFKNNIKNFPMTDAWVCSDDMKLDDQIKTIKNEQPRLIIVDSVNKIREYRNGYGTDEIEEKYRKAIEAIGSHVIFISHLNAELEIKGGTNLPHMVDSVVYLTREDTLDYIRLEMSKTKHRFGIGGRWMWLQHTNDGVEDITENYRTNGKDIYIKKQGKISDIVERVCRDKITSLNDDEYNSPKTETQELRKGNWLQQMLGITPPIK
jgi:predicted ATP-dependent serine protease